MKEMKSVFYGCFLCLSGVSAMAASNHVALSSPHAEPLMQWIPQFAYLAEEVFECLDEGDEENEPSYLCYYNIKSKVRNFADVFAGINLEEAGELSDELSFSGKIPFIVKYPHAIYMIDLYRTPNGFVFFKARQLADGTYELCEEAGREVMLPELYAKLDYLFDEFPRFEHINQLMRERGLIPAKK